MHALNINIVSSWKYSEDTSELSFCFLFCLWNISDHNFLPFILYLMNWLWIFESQAVLLSCYSSEKSHSTFYIFKHYEAVPHMCWIKSCFHKFSLIRLWNSCFINSWTQMTSKSVENCECGGQFSSQDSTRCKCPHAEPT